jgi:hypothetical protein
MSKKELIAHELDNVPEENLEALLRFVRSLTCKRAEGPSPALLAESSLAKDWLSPEEEAAWADL